MSINITIPNPRLVDVAKARELMEQHLAEVKRVTDSIRAQLAKQAIQEGYPGYTSALFVRKWESENYSLVELSPPEESSLPVIDFDETADSSFTPEQRAARRVAEGAIAAIGSDDDICEHLQLGEEHDGWYEFILDLRDEPTTTSAEVSG